MNIEYKPLSELAPAPYNPRVELQPGSPRYRKLRRSLEQFGLVEPLIWNRRTGHVVGGHQRLKILRELGFTEVPISVVDLPEDEEKALNVVLNNREAQSDFDVTRLTPLLTELKIGGHLRSTGFDPAHLQILQSELTPVQPPELQLDPDAVATTGRGHWEIILEVPDDKLSLVRQELDRLIAVYDLVAHVRMP